MSTDGVEVSLLRLRGSLGHADTEERKTHLVSTPLSSVREQVVGVDGWASWRFHVGWDDVHASGSTVEMIPTLVGAMTVLDHGTLDSVKFSEAFSWLLSGKE